MDAKSLDGKIKMPLYFSDGISVNKKVGIGAQNSLRLAGIGMKSLRKNDYSRTFRALFG
ncbi:TPA: hypothetical protein ACLAZ6_001916 [Neisseria meningitidis]|uniref:Uncharacterized protein n=6 Tax=Neisseria TaxID=482 RepID=X5ET18_NEIME|nr:hypothetical protein [Neisseria meningitidis]AHW76651.1 hypothetical protein NMA510612_2388 [Neisseria meningitidis]MCG3362374.1 hypothetical protein [Neisseria meningitidis]CBA09294.1 hypothetical protein predicted by Glimmer/Critica [Neisseria meningitidis alpha275]CBY91494.1 hypothetical protein NMAA_1555 [Neisseria meningitidis WUE 2594]